MNWELFWICFGLAFACSTYFIGRGSGYSAGKDHAATLRVTITINGDPVGGFEITDGSAEVDR